MSAATAVETFWADHQVGGPYRSVTTSRAALDKRARMYPTLHELMPVNHPGKTILDYGCGPGHDTLLFLEHGAKHVHYVDVSLQALSTTAERLRLHGYRDKATGHHVRDGKQVRPTLPKADHIHCAGVLHHVTDPYAVLRGLRHALNPGGEIRLMVYSGDESPHTQSDVPITRWWTTDDMSRLAWLARLSADHVGSYPCAAPWRPDAHADCYRLLPL